VSIGRIRAKKKKKKLEVQTANQRRELREERKVKKGVCRKVVAQPSKGGSADFKGELLRKKP